MQRLIVAFLLCLFTAPLLAEQRSITCLGRLEPKDGVIRLAGPSSGGGVIQSLSVEKGDWVDKDQQVALLNTHPLRLAEVERLGALVKNARRELSRQENLAKTSATSRVNLDDAIMKLEVAQAELAAALAQLELTVVKAPIRAQVLDIHARPGEQIGPEGIVELGRTDQMYAIAEVYETDIGAVRPGQVARISLPALDQPLGGIVEDSELSVGRIDAIGTDPIARTDARVIEVRILLDESAAVARYTNMQVDVEILP